MITHVQVKLETGHLLFPSFHINLISFPPHHSTPHHSTPCPSLLLQRRLLSRNAPTSPPPEIPTPPDRPLDRLRRRVHRRPHIQIEDRLARRLRRALVIIDDVPQLPTAALRIAPLDEPIMPIEGRLSPKRLGKRLRKHLQQLALGRGLRGPAGEVDELGRRHICQVPARAEELPAQLAVCVLLAAPAHLPPPAPALREPPLPPDDLRPRALVQEVVHRHHRLDRVRGRVRVALAQHGVVHLLRRRVLPQRAVALGDRGGLAGQGEVGRLRGGALVGDVRGHVVEGVEAGEEACGRRARCGGGGGGCGVAR